MRNKLSVTPTADKEGFVLNGSISDPTLVEQLRNAEDPEKHLREMLKAGVEILSERPTTLGSTTTTFSSAELVRLLKEAEDPRAFLRKVIQSGDWVVLPRTPHIAPSELPDLRLRFLKHWAKNGIYAQSIRSGTPSLDTFAEAMAACERAILADAGLWWVRGEMVDLVTKAATSVPLDVRVVDLPMPGGQHSGLVFLESPYVGIDAVTPGSPVYTHCFSWGYSQVVDSANKPLFKSLNLAMYSWYEYADTSQSTPGAWVYVGSTEWPYEETLEGFSLLTDENKSLTSTRQASMIEDRRFFAAFCTLVHAKLSQEDTEHPQRAIWRRSQREGISNPREASKVRIVRLREVQRKAGATDEEHARRVVNWSHRWYVEGRMAWRACGPGHSQRRLTFISPYIKGPVDKPLMLKEDVRVWSR